MHVASALAALWNHAGADHLGHGRRGDSNGGVSEQGSDAVPLPSGGLGPGAGGRRRPLLGATADRVNALGRLEDRAVSGAHGNAEGLHQDPFAFRRRTGVRLTADGSFAESFVVVGGPSGHPRDALVPGGHAPGGRHHATAQRPEACALGVGAAAAAVAAKGRAAGLIGVLGGPPPLGVLPAAAALARARALARGQWAPERGAACGIAAGVAAARLALALAVGLAQANLGPAWGAWLADAGLPIAAAGLSSWRRASLAISAGPAAPAALGPSRGGGCYRSSPALAPHVFWTPATTPPFSRGCSPETGRGFDGGQFDAA
mmetsp:Transcript_95892/g.257783  ORF Transcript_95892/g.257783 Transcript_95892/m.257783 type:complete len:318 (+) Transcript_95892:1987-2940(+)